MEQIIHEIAKEVDAILDVHNLKLSQNETRGTPEGLLAYRSQYNESAKLLVQELKELGNNALTKNAAGNPGLRTGVKSLLGLRMKQFRERNKPGL